ncbi:hypothetical protein JKF63_04431 [Porcisia hertigi]|uniref:Uncharacterized protein n=1 Tax=Porcisia hertigi TaxID=2761500 RepID=A0A836I8U5_9TRYP|nr:hypothetical protein JKF63_04431 [Porcisia hertigi]
MGFDTFLNTICLTSLILIGLWIIVYAVQAVELLLMIHAYKHHKMNVLAIPFVPLLTRLFHDIAVPQFLACVAIQRGELPPDVTTPGRHTPVVVPVEHGGAGDSPPPHALTSAYSATTSSSSSSSAPLPPTTSSTPATLLNKSLIGNFAYFFTRRRNTSNKEKRKQARGSVDDDSQRQQGVQRESSVAVVVTDPTSAAVHSSEVTSPNLAWWTPELEGQCLVLGLHLPLELLPVASPAPQATAFGKASARHAYGNNVKGNGPVSGTGATARRPTVNLQVKNYTLTPSLLDPSEATLRPGLMSRHIMLPSSAGMPGHVRTTTPQSSAWVNTFGVRSMHPCYLTPIVSTPTNITWPDVSLTSRARSHHLTFDAAKDANTQYYQRLLEVAVAEQTALAHRTQNDRKSIKRSRKITAMLMRYLEYVHMDGVTNDLRDTVPIGGAGDLGVGKGLTTSTSQSLEAAPRATARSSAGDEMNRGGVGVGTVNSTLCSQAPWIPVLVSNTFGVRGQLNAARRNRNLSSLPSGPSGSSAHHAPLSRPPARGEGRQSSSLQDHLSSPLMQSANIAVNVPPPLPLYGQQRSNTKRSRRSEETPSIPKDIAEKLEGLVERVRLTQALRPRYRSLLCTARFTAERFVVRRGLSEPPTWTPYPIKGCSAVTTELDRSFSSSTSLLSPNRCYLRDRNHHPGLGSCTEVWAPLTARDVPGSASGAQGYSNSLDHRQESNTHRDRLSHRDIYSSAPRSSGMSSFLTDGQLPSEARHHSLLESQPLLATAMPIINGGECEKINSVVINGGEPLLPAPPFPLLEPHASLSTSASLPHPGLTVTLPVDAPAELVAQFAMHSATATSHGSTSAANAAMEFLRASRLPDNHKRAAIAAGIGSSNAVVSPSTPTRYPKRSTSLDRSAYYSTTAGSLVASAPDGDEQQGAINASGSMDAARAPQPTRNAGITGDELISPVVDYSDASREGEPRVVTVDTGVQAHRNGVLGQEPTSRLTPTASHRIHQAEEQTVSSNGKETPKSAVVFSEPSPPRITAAASPPWLPPHPKDVRVVYVIGADRATLLRSLTLDATRSFAAGRQGLMCFFTRRDERRARRRYMEQLDRQNRAALQSLARGHMLGDAAMDKIHSSSVASQDNRDGKAWFTTGAATALQSTTEPPWLDLKSPIAAANVGGRSAADGVLSDTDNQQSHTTRCFDPAGAKQSAPPGIGLADSPSASAFASLTRPCDSPVFSMESLAAATVKATSLASQETAEPPAANTATDRRSSNTCDVATMPSPSTERSITSSSVNPEALAPQSYSEASSAVTVTDLRTTAPPPNTATSLLVGAGNAVEHWQTMSLAPPPSSSHTGKILKTAKTLDDSFLSLTGPGSLNDDEDDADRAAQRLSVHQGDPTGLQVHHGENGMSPLPVSGGEDAGGAPGLDVTPHPLITIRTSPISPAAEPERGGNKTTTSVSGAAAPVDDAAAPEAVKETASPPTIADNPVPLQTPPCSSARALLTDVVSAHAVGQYNATVGVTLPEQVYFLRDAHALAPWQQLHRDPATASQSASAHSSPRESFMCIAGTDTTAAVALPYATSAATHPSTLSASAAEVLCHGSTRVLEGQIEVAELSLDVLSRQIRLFVPQKPPQLGRNDVGSTTSGSGGDGIDEDDLSVLYSSSSGASDDDNLIAFCEDARHHTPSSGRRGRQQWNSKALAAASHQRGCVSKNGRRTRRSHNASCARHVHSGRWNPEHAKWSRHHRNSSMHASFEQQRQRRHARRRRRHLALWNRRIQRQRAAAIKAHAIPIACGVLFFTAPPTLPAALVQKQRQWLLQNLHDYQQRGLLVPDWALDGLKAVEPIPLYNGDERQDEPLASPSSPLGQQLPLPSICVTLIYTATAEEVAQSLVRAANVASAAHAKQRNPYAPFHPWHCRELGDSTHQRGYWDSSVTAATGSHSQRRHDSRELPCSEDKSGASPPPLSPRWLATKRMAGRWEDCQEPSPVSTAPPSKQGSFSHSFPSATVTRPLSQAALSVAPSDVFLDDESPLSHHTVGAMSTYNSQSVSSPNPHFWTQLPSEKYIKSSDCGGQDSGSGGDGTTPRADVGDPPGVAAAAAASAPEDRHGRPPCLLALTEAPDSVCNYGEGSTGSVGGATVPRSRWGGGSDRSAAARFTESEDVDDDNMMPPRSAADPVCGKHANQPQLRGVSLETDEAWRGEESKSDVADKLMNVLRDGACFPEGVPFDVSLAYVRIGNDLYAITEVVDRTFLQYREERVIKPHTPRKNGGAAAEESDEDSSVFLSDGDAVFQAGDSSSSPTVMNSSFALDKPTGTLNDAARAVESQHRPEARQQRRRRRAVSASDFGGLSYSLAGATPLRPGMRRQEVYMCWRCLSAEAVVIFVPCGHYAVCESCAELLADCCVCRTPIESSVVLLKRTNTG